MKLLRLKAPQLNKVDSSRASWTLKQFSAWIEEQPRGDAGGFAVLLRDLLVEVNHAPLQKVARLEAMELLRPVVNDACAALVTRYRNSSLPLGEGEQAVADLVRQLYAELAIGFKLVVNEQIDARERGATENITLVLQVATQRAILALGRCLLESYRVYAPEPPLLWRDLHTLFRNSEISRLQALPIEGVRDAEETALSIKQAYLRVAVLAMANPYHLMQGEAEDLYKRIGRWVHFAQIRPPAPGEPLSGHFAIDLGSDFPARYIPRSSKLPPLVEPRLLGLEKLVDTVGEQIERCNQILLSSKSSSTLSERMQRDMYVRFRDALGGRNERTSERKPTVARLTLVEGLSACHFFLNGRRPFTPEQDEAKWTGRLNTLVEDQGLKLMDDHELNGSTSTGGKVLSRSSQFQSFDTEADDIWRKANLVNADSGQDKRVRRNRYKSVHWHRKNESTGGMALFCAEDCPMQVRVGELLVYAENDSQNPADWQVGTVRWLRTRPNAGIELGIKHLARNGFAIGTQAVSGPGRGAEYLRALLIPRVNPVLQAASLVTPAGVYDVGSVLRLNMKELVIYAKLMELVETTRLFAHFRFKVVEAPLSVTARQPGAAARR